MNRESPNVLERRLAALEQDGPIDLGSVDFTVRCPDRLREFGQLIRLPEAVEGEVPTQFELLDIVQPNMPDDARGFYKAWSPQEVRHSEILGQYRSSLDLDPIPIRTKIPPKMKFIGRLMGVSPALHDTVEYITFVEGAFSELEGGTNYLKSRDIFKDIGEAPLAHEINRLRVQEAAHEGIYKLFARDRRQYMKPWQLWLTKQYVRARMPVGVRRDDRARSAEMGHVIVLMSNHTGRDILDALDDPLIGLAQELLATDQLKMSTRRAMERCVEEYQATSGHDGVL